MLCYATLAMMENDLNLTKTSCVEEVKVNSYFRVRNTCKPIKPSCKLQNVQILRQIITEKKKLDLFMYRYKIFYIFLLV